MSDTGGRAGAKGKGKGKGKAPSAGKVCGVFSRTLSLCCVGYSTQRDQIDS